MNQDAEIRHLLDLMPASGRMMTQLVSQPQQSTVIESPFPLPWKPARRILINFDLWQHLSRPQRDLILLRTVNWLCNVRWFKPDLNQGIVVASGVGLMVELLQRDAIGILLAGGLGTLGILRVWRGNHRTQTELEADELALGVSQRRGYDPSVAAIALIEAIEAIAKLEGRTSLSFVELVRTQNLKVIANISPIGVPNTVRHED
ncbi:MAG: DUF3318 domain-containing protein [Microcoleaceae cyanobacterium]